MHDLPSFMAETERRLSALEKSRRANRTEVTNGRTVWTDANGREAIEIGTEPGGTAFIRVNNADNSAVAFEVTNGTGVFPLAASAWQALYWPGLAALDAYGRQVITGTTFTNPIFSTTLSLTTPKVRASFSPECLGSVTQGQFRFWAATVSEDPRDGPSTITVGTDITFAASYPNVQTVTLDIPSTILADSSEDVVGSLVTVSLLCRISGGSGSIAVAPQGPAYCVGA